MNELSPERRAAVEARAQVLRDQLETLAELRRVYAKLREVAAKTLDLAPDALAKLEQDGDRLLSLLRDEVEALGGTLSIVVELPGRERAEFTSIVDLLD